MMLLPGVMGDLQPNQLGKGLIDFSSTPKCVNDLQIEVSHLNFMASDHRPILASCSSLAMVDQVPTRKNKILRFEECWVLSSDKGPKPIQSVFQEKLACCLCMLINWKKALLGGSIRRAIGRKEKEIQEIIRSNART